MNNSHNNLSRVVLPYALFGALYIIFSDYIARNFSSKVDDLIIISMVKGLIFIFITAVLVYYLVKNYTRKLISVNKNFDRVFQSLPEAVILFDKETQKITACNKAAQNLSEYKKNELTGISPETLFLLKSSDSNILSLLSNSENKLQLLCKLITKSGELLPVHISNSVIKNPISNTQCVLIIRDLSEINAQHREIEEQKTRLEEIMSGVDSAIWSFVDGSKGFLYLNKAAEKIFDTPFRQILENTEAALNTIVPEDQGQVLNAYMDLKSGKVKSCRLEYRILTSANKMKWLETRFWGNMDKDLQKLRVRGITSDITEIKRYQLKNKEYTNQIEGFAFLTAHMVRKPICNILGLIELMKQEEREAYLRSEYIQHLEASTLELDEVVKNLTSKIESAQNHE